MCSTKTAQNGTEPDTTTQRSTAKYNPQFPATAYRQDTHPTHAHYTYHHAMHAMHPCKRSRTQANAQTLARVHVGTAGTGTKMEPRGTLHLCSYMSMRAWQKEGSRRTGDVGPVKVWCDLARVAHMRDRHFGATDARKTNQPPLKTKQMKQMWLVREGGTCFQPMLAGTQQG